MGAMIHRMRSPAEVVSAASSGRIADGRSSNSLTHVMNEPSPSLQLLQV